MVSVDEIANKWADRASNNGQKWKSRTSEAADDFREGLMSIDGISEVGIVDEFRDGVSRVSASDFNQSVQGKQQKFRDNFVEGVADR